MIRLERIFYPVGHGAFYVERFYVDNATSPFYSVVFDCGCYNRTHLSTYQKRINSIIDNDASLPDTIDVLFISHFHTDHINGIKHLLSICDVKTIVVPQLSELERIDLYINELVQADGFDIESLIDGFTEFEDELSNKNIIQVEVCPESLSEDWHPDSVSIDNLHNTVPSGAILQKQFGEKCIWTYTPFNPSIASRASKLHYALCQSKVFGPIFNTTGNNKIEELGKMIRNGHLKELKELFKQVFNNRHNEYSMTVLSSLGDCCHQPCEKACHKAIPAQNRYCTLNCLYMGDFQPDKVNLPLLLKTYDNLQYVGLLQVPHHGSEHNYAPELFQSPRICIVSADTDDHYSHPDKKTLDGIVGNKGIVILVTETDASKQRFIYHL